MANLFLLLMAVMLWLRPLELNSQSLSFPGDSLADTLYPVTDTFSPLKANTNPISPLLISKDTLPYYKGFLDTLLLGTLLSPDTIDTLVPAPPVIRSFFYPHQLKVNSLQNEIRPYAGKELAFSILALCFTLLAGVQYNYRKRLAQIFKAFLQGRFLSQLSRAGDLYSERIALNLFLVFLLTMPLLILEINNIFGFYKAPGGASGQLITYLILLATFASLYGLKIIAIRLAGVIFRTVETSQEYTLTMVVFNLVEGIIAASFLVIICFSMSVLALRLCLVLLGMTIVYRLLRSFFLGLVNSKYSFFYLFLFFSTLEVLPLFIIIKAGMLVLNTGVF